MLKRSIELITKKDDKITIKIEHEIANTLIQKAMENAINNTLNEMVKCKDIDAINELALQREQEHRILSIALNNKNYNNIAIAIKDVESLNNSLIEYKKILTSDIKKSDDIDELCDKMYYCNRLLSQIA